MEQWPARNRTIKGYLEIINLQVVDLEDNVRCQVESQKEYKLGLNSLLSCMSSYQAVKWFETGGSQQHTIWPCCGKMFAIRRWERRRWPRQTRRGCRSYTTVRHSKNLSVPKSGKPDHFQRAFSNAGLRFDGGANKATTPHLLAPETRGRTCNSSRPSNGMLWAPSKYMICW